MKAKTLLAFVPFLVASTSWGFQASSSVERKIQTDSQTAVLQQLERALRSARSTSQQVAFDNSTLKGDYAFSSTGGCSVFLLFAGVYQTDVQARLGIWSFDGKGQFTRTRVANGSISGRDNLRTFTGFYSVSSSGAVVFVFLSGLQMGGFIVDGGDGFVFAEVSGDCPEAGYARRL